MDTLNPAIPKRGALLAAALLAAVLPACGDRGAPRAGQALVSVNGEEITAMQLNEELQRANVHPTQQKAATMQLLEALVDRQLLQNEAEREKLDRDPKVVQAVERARALIVAQAYMQRKVAGIARPTAREVADYYAGHPEFFANRKQFDMRQLVLDTRDLTDTVTRVADQARTLDDVAAWLDAHKVSYVRAQALRSTSDLAPELGARLRGMKPGQLFVVREGPRSLLVALAEVRDSPASLEVAAPQIEKFLAGQRAKDAAEAELARLRANARIDYLNPPAGTAAGATVLPAGPAAAAAAEAAAGAARAAPSAAPPADAATARGVAGLR